jgi:hypothetical protein
MFTLCGPRSTFCDGIARRSFLGIGALGLGGLTLPRLLAAEDSAPAARANRHKSVIMVYLSGGMAHQDTFDLKPDAPDEVRGEFRPIDTNVPGVRIGEHLPKLARTMDRISLVRSIVGLADEHTSFQNLTGWRMNEAQRDGRPNFGSTVSRVLGPVDPVTPPFVDLFPTMQHRPYNSPAAGYMGPVHAGVRADGENLASMKLRYVAPEQFVRRKDLLATLDGYRRAVDDAAAAPVDASWSRAFDVLTSSRLVEALDVTREDPAVRAAYGQGSSRHIGDGAPLWNDQLLMARRLVEAGVRCVTVAFGFWDTHGSNFSSLKSRLPGFDTGIAALVKDIHDRGLAEDCTVLVWGEFGRTPKINKGAGRDHWAPDNFALFSGGGMPGGQVIGSTDKDAAYAATRPIPYQDVLATVYRTLGIDPHEFVRDMNERPVQLLPDRFRPIPELS